MFIQINDNHVVNMECILKATYTPPEGSEKAHLKLALSQAEGSGVIHVEEGGWSERAWAILISNRNG